MIKISFYLLIKDIIWTLHISVDLKPNLNDVYVPRMNNLFESQILMLSLIFAAVKDICKILFLLLFAVKPC